MAKIYIQFKGENSSLQFKEQWCIQQLAFLWNADTAFTTPSCAKEELGAG